uniref:Bifunctional inhibitor/plant lipid transfer protein/seed storage helical domain-containing protein n=1 Tax=Leersia perrieri TaxID=77586 RepID=A0A0D9VX58_9ORYZ
MARSVHGVRLALAIVAVVVVAATPCAGQRPRGTPPLALPSCPAAPISLSPCIGYVFGAGSATLSSCCSELRTFFLSQGPCLCAASKLATAGPFGLLLGQAQVLKPLIPNVCNLPSNPCDDVVVESSEPASKTPLAPAAAPDTPAMTPSEEPDDDPEESEAPPVPVDHSPAAVTAPGQVVPGDAGSSAGSQIGTKLPELLHSAGVASSRNTGAGAVLITLSLAYVSAMYI